MKDEREDRRQTSDRRICDAPLSQSQIERRKTPDRRTPDVGFLKFDETIELPQRKHDASNGLAPHTIDQKGAHPIQQARHLILQNAKEDWARTNVIPRRRRKDARPREIAAAALDIFVAKGYEASRIAEIADRAGIAKGTLYLYFHSKEALFKSIIEESVVPALEAGEKLVASYEGDSSDLLNLLLRSLGEQINASHLSSIINLVISESRKFPEIAQHYYEICIVRGRALLRSVIERGIQSKEFNNLDIASCINIAVAPIVMQTIWRHSFLSCEENMNFQAYMDTHLALFMNGLKNHRQLADESVQSATEK